MTLVIVLLKKKKTFTEDMLKELIVPNIELKNTEKNGKKNSNIDFNQFIMANIKLNVYFVEVL